MESPIDPNHAMNDLSESIINPAPALGTYPLSDVVTKTSPLPSHYSLE